MQLLAEIQFRAPSFVDGTPLNDELITQLIFGADTASSASFAGTSDFSAAIIQRAERAGLFAGVAAFSATPSQQATFAGSANFSATLRTTIFSAASTAGAASFTATISNAAAPLPDYGVISEEEMDRRTMRHGVDPRGEARAKGWRL